jgi:hypothetical protein
MVHYSPLARIAKGSLGVLKKKKYLQTQGLIQMTNSSTTAESSYE